MIRQEIDKIKQLARDEGAATLLVSVEPRPDGTSLVVVRVLGGLAVNPVDHLNRDDYTDRGYAIGRSVLLAIHNATQDLPGMSDPLDITVEV